MGSITNSDNGWVELRHLEYFLAVADNRSFTEAAKRLNVVQSGVSATIKALERELGVELFVRGPTGVVLTPAGEELRPRARDTLDAARAAKDAVNATRGAVRGTVTVGTLPSIGVVDLPTLLADLHARLVAAVSLHLVVPADHPLAQRDSVPLAELAGMSFVDGPPGYGNRMVVDQAFAAAGVERTIALEVADIGTTTTHIRNGLGIGFLSWSMLDKIDDSGLVTVRIADYDLEWRLYVATSAIRPRSAATGAVLSLIEEVIPRS